LPATPFTPVMLEVITMLPPSRMRGSCICR